MDDHFDQQETRLDQSAPAKKAKTLPTMSGPEMERTKLKVSAQMANGIWDGSKGKHYVALFEILHEQVYGTAPLEMTGRVRHIASLLAWRILTQHFQGDEGEMAAFVRWVWIRELGRVKWRQENGRDPRRIDYMQQFSGGFVTDYRVAKSAERSDPRTYR
jgi:hypothetical protein